MTLARILDALDRHRQRATYGAVSQLLGVPARSLMSGRPKDPRHSWVVRKSNGLPTGYAPMQRHPELERNPHVIEAGYELRTWLETEGSAVAAV